jgi:predicted RNase H-like HicB family nuclease
MKITIEIQRDEDGKFFIRSKEMKCSYVIGEDVHTIKEEVSYLVENWLYLNELIEDEP